MISLKSDSHGVKVQDHRSDLISIRDSLNRECFRNFISILTTMVVHSNFSDFATFLYVHMAYADGDYHPEEMHVIIDKMKKLYPPNEDLHSKLEKTLEDYRSTDQSKISTIVRDSFKHFNQVKFAHKYKVYTDMYDIINADGKVDESETKALDELKQIINMGAEK